MNASSSTATASTKCAELFRGNWRRALLPCLRSDSVAAAQRRLFRFLRLAAEADARLAGDRTAFPFAFLKLHPDNFVRASEATRQLSLDRSSQLNDAYRTLRDPVARVAYLLEPFGMCAKKGRKTAGAPGTARRSV